MATKRLLLGLLLMLMDVTPSSSSSLVDDGTSPRGVMARRTTNEESQEELVETVTGVDAAFYCSRDELLTCRVVASDDDELDELHYYYAPYEWMNGLGGKDELEGGVLLDFNEFQPGDNVTFVIPNGGLNGTTGFYLDVGGKQKEQEDDQDMASTYYSDPYQNQNRHDVVVKSTSFLKEDSSTVSKTIVTFHHEADENGSVVFEMECQGLTPMALVYDISDAESATTSCELDKYQIMTDEQFQHRYETPRPTHNGHKEQVIQFALLFPSGILSLFGSTIIIYCIVVRWRKNKQSCTRDRLLLLMSTLDMFNSFALSLSSIPASPNDLDVFLASGTATTCSLQGMAIQIGFAVPICNTMLCIYYLLIAGYMWDPDRIDKSRWLQGTMLGLPICFAVVTSIYGAVQGLFNPTGLCWIEPYPYDCQYKPYEDCTRGENAGFYVLLFGAIPLVLSFLAQFSLLAWLYCKVARRNRMMERMMEQRRSQSMAFNPSTSAAFSTNYNNNCRSSSLAFNSAPSTSLHLSPPGATTAATQTGTGRSEEVVSRNLTITPIFENRKAEEEVVDFGEEEELEDVLIHGDIGKGKEEEEDFHNEADDAVNSHTEEEHDSSHNGSEEENTKNTGATTAEPGQHPERREEASQGGARLEERMKVDSSQHQQPQRKQKQPKSRRRDPRLTAIAVQASLYVGAFFMTYFWSILLVLLGLASVDFGFWLHSIVYFFMPLQGFWNCLIFLRPTFQRVHQKHSKNNNANDPKSYFWMVRRAIVEESTGYEVPKRRPMSRVLQLQASRRKSSSM